MLRLIAIIVVTPVVFLLGWQSRLIYYPRPYGERDMAELRKAGGRQLAYRTTQGNQTAFYIPPLTRANDQPYRIWLCFAGNGSVALDWLYSIENWDRSCAYLLVDYPQYGLCEGKPNPTSIRESSLAAVKRLAEELQVSIDDLKPKLSVIGHSIGCAAALMIADDLDLKRAVLISPFTTMTEMGRRILGWPLCHLNRHKFDNRTHLAAIVKKGARVTIFHGTDDHNVPISMSRELAGAHSDAVKLIEVAGAGHNDIMSIAETQIASEMR
jgi:pimeloyl-ACP methyl ester carboxylesterase